MKDQSLVISVSNKGNLYEGSLLKDEPDLQLDKIIQLLGLNLESENKE